MNQKTKTREMVAIDPLYSFHESGGKVDFDALFQENYPKVFRHIAYLTGNIQAAEDIAQEVFTRLYKAPPEHSNVSAWLFKVANNLAYNHLRDEKTRTVKESVISVGEEDKIISIEDKAIRNQEVRQIRKALIALPERDRMCLLLKFSGYRYHEIAEVIGVEKTSVGTILARCQAKFMEKFSKEE
jgi:RNA polymerase sigma factor (sigma-70 family)